MSSDGQEALNEIESRDIQQEEEEVQCIAPLNHEPDTSPDRGKARLAIVMCRRGLKGPEALC